MSREQEFVKQLGISVDEYRQEVHDSGKAFLESYLNSTDGYVTYILSTPEYWAWWINQFEMGTADYLSVDHEPSVVRWKLWHEPDRVRALPWSKAMDKGYELMIKELIDKEVKNG